MDAVETKTPENLPASAPLAQSCPVPSQKVYREYGDEITVGTAETCAYLPLSGEIAVAGRDAKKESVELTDISRAKDGVVRLWGRVHEFEYVLGERLGDPWSMVSRCNLVEVVRYALVDRRLTTGGLDPGLFSLSDWTNGRIRYTL
jgi:hypothetical protein